MNIVKVYVDENVFFNYNISISERSDFMDYLAFWIYSSVVSVFFNLLNDAHIFKYAADNGTIVNLRELSFATKKYLQRYLKLLIPVYNLIKVAMNLASQRVMIPTLYDKLTEYDMLYEMDDFDRFRYAKKPTLRNALKLTIEIYKEMNTKEEYESVFAEMFGECDLKTVNANVDGIDIIITYELIDGNICIADIEGSDTMTEEEAKKIVYEKTGTQKTVQDTIKDLKETKNMFINMSETNDKDNTKCNGQYIKK